jgi:hypothetical protein
MTTYSDLCNPDACTEVKHFKCWILVLLNGSISKKVKNKVRGKVVTMPKQHVMKTYGRKKTKAPPILISAGEGTGGPPVWAVLTMWEGNREQKRAIGVATVSNKYS